MINLTTYIKDNYQQLCAILYKFHSAKVLVIADLTLDEFVMGTAERVSREAPVLIIRHEETRQVPGGGANTLYNLAILGANVTAIGIVGDDLQGKDLLRILNGVKIETKLVSLVPNWVTITKSRITAHARQSVMQQIVRLDRKPKTFPTQNTIAEIVKNIQTAITEADAVICSDYGDGVFSNEVIQAALSHKQVMVDSQKDLHRFLGATIFTPNLPEAEQAVGYPIQNEEDLQKAGRELIQKTQAKYVLITQGEAGMTLFEQEANFVNSVTIPAYNKTEVFDVTGAGDTVISVLGLALCVGANALDAAILGNLAAGIVVRKFGTATATIEEILAVLTEIMNNGE